MNKYKILLKSTDPMGMRFLNNVVLFANAGATLDRDYIPSMKFPFKAMFDYETSDYLETNQEMEVIPLELVYTKEMLDNLEWEEFKKVVGAKGIGGRARELMTNNYLKAVTQSKEEADE